MLPQVTELRKPDCFVMRLYSLRTGQRIQVEIAEFWTKALIALPNEKNCVNIIFFLVMLGIKFRGLCTWIDKHTTTGPHFLLQGPVWNLQVAALVETAGQLRCSTDSFILITFHTCNINRQWNVAEGLMKKGPIYEWGNFLLCVKGLSWNVDLLLQFCFLVVPPDSSTENDFY